MAMARTVLASVSKTKARILSGFVLTVGLAIVIWMASEIGSRDYLRLTRPGRAFDLLFVGIAMLLAWWGVERNYSRKRDFLWISNGYLRSYREDLYWIPLERIQSVRFRDGSKKCIEVVYDDTTASFGTFLADRPADAIKSALIEAVIAACPDGPLSRSVTPGAGTKVV